MTNKEKENYFIERTKYYFFDIFKLYDYELSIEKDFDNDVRASTLYHNIADGTGMISIFYSTHWINSKKTFKEEIDVIAFHEVMEAILWELQSLSESRFIMPKDIPNAVHRVIRRFENIIHPLIINNKRI